MAYLTKPEKYNIEDTNIALLGSDLEKRVREHAGDKEAAWEAAGLEPGLQIWRIEKFQVVDWPKDRYGYFYNGDSYIVLNTYKKTPDADKLSYDLHFWLGEDTSQDEAGTAAYKTVELDDHLDGSPVEYREVQNFESPRFLSYFSRFVCLNGGVSTGFHHVTAPPPDNIRRLYKITASHGTGLIVREVKPDGASLCKGDVFVLDQGDKIRQFNAHHSVGKEKFKAAEFVRSLADGRENQCEVTVYDEGSSGAGIFLSEFGLTALPSHAETPTDISGPRLFRLSDASGTASFDPVEPVSYSSLASEDAFLLDDSSNRRFPAVYVWIGKGATLNEARLVMTYGQRFLHDKRAASGAEARISLIKSRECTEPGSFLQSMGA